MLRRWQSALSAVANIRNVPQICPTLLEKRSCTTLTKAQSLALIKQLRAQTGAPIGDVKSALEETNYDVDAAFDSLRKKGAAAAAKKADRAASQGLVSVVREGRKVALVEVNCETDFVARNESFQSLMPLVARAALQRLPDSGESTLDLDDLLSETVDGQTVEAAAKAVAGTVRENVVVRGAAGFAASSRGHIETYVHNTLAPGCGAMAAAVALEHDSLDLSQNVPEDVAELSKQLAMQVVAMDPVSISRERLPPDAVEREIALLTDQARSQSPPPKSDAVLQRIVAGRLEKFYQAHALLDQPSIIEEKATVGRLLQGLGKVHGGEFRVAAFGCVKVGLPLRIQTA